MSAKLCDLFLGIPCEPPPTIAHGRYTVLDEYFYGLTVTYSCAAVLKGADPFSLIGTSRIVCTYDANLNGVWSAPPPQCKGCWDFFMYFFVITYVSPKLQYLSPFWKRWKMDCPIEKKKQIL